MNSNKENNLTILLIQARYALDNVGMQDSSIDYEHVRKVKMMLIGELSSRGVALQTNEFNRVTNVNRTIFELLLKAKREAINSTDLLSQVARLTEENRELVKDVNRVMNDRDELEAENVKLKIELEDYSIAMSKVTAYLEKSTKYYSEALGAQHNLVDW